MHSTSIAFAEICLMLSVQRRGGSSLDGATLPGGNWSLMTNTLANFVMSL